MTRRMDESQIRRDRAPRQRLLVIVVLLGVLTFLALPSVVLADDCSSATTGEVNVKDCFRRFPIATLGMMMAMFGALGMGMWAAAAGYDEKPAPKPPELWPGPPKERPLEYPAYLPEHPRPERGDPDFVDEGM